VISKLRADLQEVEGLVAGSAEGTPTAAHAAALAAAAFAQQSSPRSGGSRGQRPPSSGGSLSKQGSRELELSRQQVGWGWGWGWFLCGCVVHKLAELISRAGSRARLVCCAWPH
jgi:hypothetical protein